LGGKLSTHLYFTVIFKTFSCQNVLIPRICKLKHKIKGGHSVTGSEWKEIEDNLWKWNMDKGRQREKQNRYQKTRR
jgi:hypothetical protein